MDGTPHDIVTSDFESGLINQSAYRDLGDGWGKIVPTLASNLLQICHQNGGEESNKKVGIENLAMTVKAGRYRERCGEKGSLI